jgi:hypothetical protein
MTGAAALIWRDAPLARISVEGNILLPANA